MGGLKVCVKDVSVILMGWDVKLEICIYVDFVSEMCEIKYFYKFGIKV